MADKICHPFADSTPPIYRRNLLRFKTRQKQAVSVDTTKTTNARLFPENPNGPKHRHVVLIGPTGAGKTTIGRRLAKLMRRPFYDVDEELERTTGVSVNLIFEIEKEAGFRRREAIMLARLLRKPAAVIATGAGVIVNEDNRRLLQNSTALIVYLQTSVEQQLFRLSHDKRRPLLQVPDREQRLRDMARERNPWYEAVSDTTIRTSDRSSYRMARDIYREIKPLLINR